MTKKPNILFILPDQLRRDFLGCYGADFLSTPNLDALASEGTQFNKAISQYPICIPARAAMLTGLPATETGVVDNGKWLRPDRRDMGIKSWPEFLNEAGYHTAAIGKMHFIPWDNDEGFAERIISEDKRHHWINDDYADALEKRGFEKKHGRELEGYDAQKGACVNPLPDDLLPDHWVADRTLEFLERQTEDQPFAAMIGFPSPHCPYDPASDWLKHIDIDAIPDPLPETDGSRAQKDAMVANFKQPWADIDYSNLTVEQAKVIRHHYAALVETIDREVGRILAALKNSAFGDNTVVIFASDHGDFLGDFGLIGKGSFYASAIDIPMIVRDYREDAGHRQISAPVSLTDVFPTFLELAGVEVPSTQDRFPSLLSAHDPERRIFGICPRGAMIVGPHYKYCRRSTGEAEAYDMLADPGEQDDLLRSGTNHAELQEYDSLLSRYLIEAISQGHNDKSVVESIAENEENFGRRDWSRPYPAGISKTAIRNV